MRPVWVFLGVGLTYAGSAFACGEKSPAEEAAFHTLSQCIAEQINAKDDGTLLVMQVVDTVFNQWCEAPLNAVVNATHQSMRQSCEGFNASTESLKSRA